jgi:type I restriction enzyme S subunit
MEEVAVIVMGQSPLSSTYNDKGRGLPFFQGKAEFTELHPVVRKWCSEPKRIAEPNDVLVSVRAPVGSTNIANQKCCIGRGLAAIRYPPQHRFLFYYLRLVERKLDEKGTGTTFRAISGDVLRELDFPLPPLSEQHRIVEKIETLFSELDKGIEQLKTAQQQLKVYRQSVLKWAFEGKLSAEWRKSKISNPKSQSAQDLLECIKYEHEQQAKVSAKKLKPIVPFTESELSELSDLPKDWRWTKLEDLAANEANSVTDGPFGSNLKTSHYVKNGPRVVRLQNIGEGQFVEADAHISVEHFQKLRKHQILGGDIAIASFGADPPRACIIPESLGLAIVKADCIRFKPHPLMNGRWINFALNSDPTRKWSKKSVHGVGRPRLNLGNIRLIPIPVPSIDEQNEIVSEIDRRLSVCEKLEQTINDSLQQSEALRQSILKKAFEGRLAEQDPNDPPASEMLEKIKKEKEGLRRASPPASELLQRIKVEKASREANKVGATKKGLRRAGEPASVLLR